MNAFTECNITAMGLIQKYICGYEVLFWLFVSCVSNQRLQNGVPFSFELKYFKRVSLIGKFDNTKWTWWIKLASVNSGSERLKWGLLRVSETGMSLPDEYWSSKSYFWRCRKISGYQEGKTLLSYWKLNLMICDHWLR